MEISVAQVTLGGLYRETEEPFRSGRAVGASAEAMWNPAEDGTMTNYWLELRTERGKYFRQELRRLELTDAPS